MGKAGLTSQVVGKMKIPKGIIIPMTQAKKQAIPPNWFTGPEMQQLQQNWLLLGHVSWRRGILLIYIIFIKKLMGFQCGKNLDFTLHSLSMYVWYEFAQEYLEEEAFLIIVSLKRYYLFTLVKRIFGQIQTLFHETHAKKYDFWRQLWWKFGAGEVASEMGV